MAQLASRTTYSLRAAVVIVAALGLLAAPSLDGGTEQTPEAVTASSTVALPATADPDGWHVSGAADADDVVMVGARWDAAGASEVELRTRTDGAWGDWMPFHVQHEHGPDHHSEGDPVGDVVDEVGHDGHGHGEDHEEEDHHHTGGDGVSTAEPLWLGRVDGLQVRADGPTEVHLDGVQMSGESLLAHEARPPGPGAAVAGVGPPEIVPRTSWDPEGRCRPREAPEYGDVRMAHVHHTVMYPRYSPEEADDVVRALCLFHTELRGWSDLGYNFLVDKYGRLYEGRAGGSDRAVVGAHAAGFNASSVGISFIGDYETNPVSEQSLAALERLLAWKFAAHDVNPVGRTRVVSTGGQAGLSQFGSGSVAELPTVVGHRDTGAATLCPGRYLYAAMERSPQRVADLMVAAGVELAPADPPPLELPEDPSPSVEGAHPQPGEEPPTGEQLVTAAGSTTLPATGWGAVALSLLTLCAAAVLGEVTTRRRHRP